MVEAGLVVGLLLALAAPHLVASRSATPRTAALLWLSALGLRAATAIGAAVFVVAYLPRTEFFQTLADWCWATISHHVGFTGHPLAHATALLPAMAIVAALAGVLFGLLRAALALRRHLARRSRGAGPMGSVVIDDDEIVVAVAGVGRPRIVISDGALAAMDAHELRASLTHEIGHLRRRHRPVLLVGTVCAAVGRLIPGTSRAQRELHFSLERDADEYAVGQTRDPLALASAICKAAIGPAAFRSATGLGGEGSVADRLGHLTGDAGGASTFAARATLALACLLAAITVGLWASLPTWALAAPPAPEPNSPACPH